MIASHIWDGVLSWGSAGTWCRRYKRTRRQGGNAGPPKGPEGGAHCIPQFSGAACTDACFRPFLSGPERFLDCRIQHNCPPMQSETALLCSCGNYLSLSLMCLAGLGALGIDGADTRTLAPTVPLDLEAFRA